MTSFVFCHGFGFNKHFWDNLTPYFVQEHCFFIDLGYFNRPYFPPDFEGEKIIGIGHSLGLLKLIKFYKNFECLIGLNGFTNFLGNEAFLRRKRLLELKTLKRNLELNPKTTLKRFYERCGIPEFIDHCPENLVLEKMVSDLKVLETSIALPAVPTLLLMAADDPVVPQQLTMEMIEGFPSVQYHSFDQGGHNLGYVKALEVYEKITRFLNEQLL